MARDPVCGMMVKEEGLKAVHDGQAYYFCSDFCRNLFEKDPEKYGGVFVSTFFGITSEKMDLQNLTRSSSSWYSKKREPRI